MMYFSIPTLILTIILASLVLRWIDHNSRRPRYFK